jgi:hypothetical protein
LEERPEEAPSYPKKKREDQRNLKWKAGIAPKKNHLKTSQNVLGNCCEYD